MRRLPAFLALWCAGIIPSGAQEPGGPAAIAQGQKLYAAACSGCHGKPGEGGRGPNLNDGALIRRLRDERLANAIRNGVPAQEWS